ncbi:PD40 domain-containing protein [Kitasatospora mediocidica]|uniref:PD40 domain-containing protein n=1 Tax=Kitasatospora mediocidica TaxID=58352 RepID=UPI00056CD3D3|nr:PD40 domain-containing protein [Kitasatospora mediocidica]
MSARARRHTNAVLLTLAVTTGATLLLTSCGPTSTPAASASNSVSPIAASVPTPSPTQSAAGAATPTTGASASASASATGTTAAPSATPSTAPTQPASAKPSAAPSTATAAPVPLNGTGHNGLTISNGTRYVVMNGTTVDFGTDVTGLAWSPDGRKAAFIDGAGNLSVANPDGSARVTVAKHPAGETWSHPTWQVQAASPQGYYPAKDNLLFAAAKAGVYRLEGVSATAVSGTPHQLSLGNYSGDNVKANPETGNLWPVGDAANGSSVYANSDNGEVYIRDESLRQQGGPVSAGSQPSLSPNGAEIVFVRSVGGHDHLFERETYSTADAKDLTPNTTVNYTEPTWSPDGTTIAARTAQGIVTLAANGSGKPTLVSGYQGLPAYRHR